jgi:hypothetical protein
MNKPPDPIARLQQRNRSPKRRGELVELAFLHKAVSLGFGVAQPFGDSAPYDFILDPHSQDSDHPSPHRLWRVQVKSTARLRKGGYLIGACHFSSRNTKQSYTPDQIDCLAVYIIPHDAWYIIPIQAFYPQKWLSFYPQNPNSKARFEPYRNAWQAIGNPSCGADTPVRRL